MLESSIGGAAATHNVHRHPLLRAIILLMAPLFLGGAGWSPGNTALCALVMSFSEASTLAARFRSARALLNSHLPRRRRVGRTYQGWVKALTRHGGSLVAALRSILRARTAGIIRAGELVPLAVDGSKFDAPRTIANESLGVTSKCGPQLLATVILHVDTGLVWDFRIGRSDASERHHLRAMIRRLPENALIIADAGFVGYDMLRTLHNSGIRFLIRAGANVRLLRGLDPKAAPDAAHLWPRRFDAPMRLRVIRTDGVCLLTNITDPRKLSRRAALDLYRRRWGIELFFRTVKQIMQRRKMRSGQPVHARLELSFTLLSAWMLALLGPRAIRVSPAAVLRVIRDAAAGTCGLRPWKERLARCLIDPYRRTTSRKAWNWPHKKHDPPCGVPRMTAASLAQVLAAQQLRFKSQIT
jgi:hypothetical protein